MMHIERTTNSDIDPLAHGALSDRPARTSGSSDRGYEVDTDPAGYVHKALSMSSTPAAESISRARALLASSYLDSPATCRQAAANLAMLGV